MGIYKNTLLLPILNARGGLYTKGYLVKQSLLFRSWGQIHFPVAYSGQNIYSNEEILYGGQLFSHFGHFILESLARVWYLREYRDIPIAWSARGEKLYAYQQEILDFLGISICPILVEEPTVFRKIHLPEPGYIIQNIFQTGHMKALSVIEPSNIIKEKKVYVSRSKLTECGGATNEKELEGKMAQEGWEIFHPQDYPVSHQLREISSAEYICGISGSAFHSLIFLNHLDSKLILLPRPEGFNNNYNTIAAAKKFNQHVINHDLLYSYSSGKGYKTRATLNIEKAIELIKTQIIQKKFIPPKSNTLHFATYKSWIAKRVSTQDWHTEDVTNIQYLKSLSKKGDYLDVETSTIISAIARRSNELYFNLILFEHKKRIHTLQSLLELFSEIIISEKKSIQTSSFLIKTYNKLRFIDIHINEKWIHTFLQSNQDNFFPNLCLKLSTPKKTDCSINNIERMVEKFPRSDLWRFRYSVVLLANNRIDDAFNQIKIAIELNSKKHEHYFVVSQIFLKNYQFSNYFISFRHTLSLLLKSWS